MVALGAGAYAGIRQRDKGIGDIVMTDVCPFTLGIETHQQQGDENGYLLPVIRRNSTLPSKAKKSIVTLSDYQTMVGVKVYQGEEYYASNNLFLGEVCIDVEPKPAGQEMVTVQFKYDINGILQVEVENSRGEKKQILLANQSLTESELEKYQREMDRVIHITSPWENEENMKLFQILMKYYKESSGNRKEQLGKFLKRYSECFNSGRLKRIKEAVLEMKKLVESLENYDKEKENIYFNGSEKYTNKYEE